MSYTDVELTWGDYNYLKTTAPVGGTVRGQMYIIEDVFCIALETKDAGESLTFITQADSILIEKGTGAIAVGALVYADRSELTVLGTNSDKCVGYCKVAALSADARVHVAFNGWAAFENKIYLTGVIADISTANSNVLIPCPVAGDITYGQGTLYGTIATADSTVTVKIGTTAVTGGAFTVAYDGSAKLDVDTITPTALNTVAKGDVIEVITDGASTNAIAWGFVLEITLAP